MKYKVYKKSPRIVQVSIEDDVDELTVTAEDIERINNWVNEHNLGKRSAWDMWQLNAPADQLMFILKWHGQQAC